MPRVITSRCTKCGKKLDDLYYCVHEVMREEHMSLLQHDRGIFCDFKNGDSCFKDFCNQCYNSETHKCEDWYG